MQTRVIINLFYKYRFIYAAEGRASAEKRSRKRSLTLNKYILLAMQINMRWKPYLFKSQYFLKRIVSLIYKKKSITMTDGFIMVA